MKLSQTSVWYSDNSDGSFFQLSAVCVCVFCQTAAAGPALSGQFPAGAAAPQPTEAAHAGAPAARSRHAQPASPGQSLLHTVLRPPLAL